MVWNPGDDDDINEGGARQRRRRGQRRRQRRGLHDQAGADGRPRLVRPHRPTPPGPFNVDIGTTELLRLNANDGNDKVKGADGHRRADPHELNGDGGNDTIKGTDAEDRLSGGKGFDVLKARDKAEDTVSCDSGLDLAIVDRRDFVRQCEIVIGGRLRVAMLGAGKVRGDAASLRLRCVATAKCVGTAKVVKGKKTMAKARYHAQARQAEVRRAQADAAGPQGARRRQAARSAPARHARRAGQRLADDRQADARPLAHHHPADPAPPLNGPRRSAVIQPP